MHTDDQNPLQPQPEEFSLDAETGAEADTSSGAAPFAGFEHDPGIENPEASGEASGEAAAAAESMEPISYRELDSVQLQSAVEAVLFMQHKPMSLAKLRELIHPEIAEDDYRTALSNLQATYFDESRGIELLEVAGGFQFRTKSDNKDIIRRMYQIAPMKLTNAMLEVLAIVAYNQPLTREGIDKVRGVDSSHLVRTLLDKKMLRIVGKSDELGRPMLYGTTKDFLELFGLRDLGSLPSLRELEEMLPANEVGAEVSEEDVLAKEMEGIVDSSKPLEFNDLELEDLENETPTIAKTESAVPAQADGHGRTSGDGSPAPRSEADGDDVDFTTEASRRLPIGPEGNA